MVANTHSSTRLIGRAVLLLALLLALTMAYFIRQELLTSSFQARYLAKIAGEAIHTVGAGPSPAIRYPGAGPYDKRIGHTDIPVFIENLQAKQFEIAQQARQSPRTMWLADHGISPPYREKTQAGLTLRDRRAVSVVSLSYPERVYQRYEDIPPIVIDTLLFIENRRLLDLRYPKQNPAIDWTRLTRAVSERALQGFSAEERTAGGSTLATQMEKFRHSPNGRTDSIREKLRQMGSASLRAYREGEDTTLARRQIVLDYLNSMPLAAKPGYGEVNSFGNGLWVWYGTEFKAASRILSAISDPSDALKEGNSAEALIYKHALSLLIAQRRPSHFFSGNGQELDDLTNSYLRLLANSGLISPTLSHDAQKIRLAFSDASAMPAPAAFSAQKTSTTLRTHLAGLLGISRLYDLDRLDIEGDSSIDLQLQDAVTPVLRAIRDPVMAASAGLIGKQLLDRGDPSQVLYSFTLLERGEEANYLRVQTDNFDQPFDINTSAKLDLGSTAKLRTVITYLEIVADLHGRFGTVPREQLRHVVLDPQDHITHWAITYLRNQRSAPPLGAMLEAALDRRYAANPGEQFFTGGGLHTFANFRREDNDRLLSVREGMRNSVNLVFVRLLRDIVHHTMVQGPTSSAQLLQLAGDPRRAEYLTRFADQEGRQFLQRFYRKYRGMTAADIETKLLQGVRPTAPHLASVFRSIAPDASETAFDAFLLRNLPSHQLSDATLARLYQQYAPQNMSLGDRGYVAGVHPLELWVAAFLCTHPDATLAEIIAASAGERQSVYKWLFSAHRKHAQDKRIRSLLEVEAFLEIHRRWQRLGYPFGALVPSYATALGASADRPAALAELMGIIVNDGVRKPSVLVESVRFAQGSPYETVMRRRTDDAQRVLPAEVAHAVRGLLRDVVDNGTAKRAKGLFKRADGSIAPLGGKTGTGDHRYDVVGPHGQLLASRVVNRSATFVFSIDDRFFGTLTAYVPGSGAAEYDFTSALPVQLLKVLAPILMPYIEEPASGASVGND